MQAWGFFFVAGGVAIGVWNSAAPQISSLSAHLPNINSVRQHFVADETQGKSLLLANWAGAKSVCREAIGVEHPPAIIGVVHPTSNNWGRASHQQSSLASPLLVA